VRDAIPLAQRYIAEAIRNAPDLGKGHGPMNHMVQVEKWKSGKVEK
jgi:hydroxymethylpyrimidine/phosphomethylpyrimidine kinase